jgi:hypothetical protein
MSHFAVLSDFNGLASIFTREGFSRTGEGATAGRLPFANAFSLFEKRENVTKLFAPRHGR